MSDETTNGKRTEDLVVPPGGPRPRESVHRVDPGEAVRIDEAGTPVIVPQQPADLGRLDEIVVTPGGYRHRSLVHLIDRGNVLVCTGGHHRQLDPAGRVAVSRSKDKLDIFVVDEDSVKTATWELDAGWSDWKWLLPGG